MQKTLFSTADVATLFSVTETTVKRWADEGLLKCQRTPGGHRKFDTKQITEFADSFGFTPTATLALDDKHGDQASLQVAVLSRDFGTITAAFVQRALADDGPGLQEFFSYLYQHNIHLWEMFDLVIRPGMGAIGDGWKRGDVGIGAEHRSSERTVEALAQLKPQIHMKHQNGHVALLACPEDVHHELGLRCASLALEAEGWKVHYLGANTPIESILETQSKIRPSLICLSISVVDPLAHLNAQLRKIFRAAAERNARLVIGGPPELENHIGKGECHKLVHSCKELIEYVATLNGAKKETR
jgi:methanogenic corrinoid protein MtbC1